MARFTSRRARAHGEAQLARRVADRDSQMVLYRDVELAALMSGEPDGVRRLIARELGALAVADRGMGELRETLRVFQASNANTRQAAAALHMHRNTVLYRLRRVEELIGHRVADRRPSLEVALNLAHMLGEGVLADRPADFSDMLHGS